MGEGVSGWLLYMGMRLENATAHDRHSLDLGGGVEGLGSGRYSGLGTASRGTRGWAEGTGDAQG
jgi:hypothetical protein